MDSSSKLIEVNEQTLAEMVVLGFARIAEDGVHEITPKGSAWLDDWCADRIRNHPHCMCKTTDEGWCPCPPSLCEIPNHIHRSE